MDISIRWKGTEKSPEVAEHVRRRAGFSLDRIAGRLRRVVVRFEDLNGPRGGVDKACFVELSGDFGTRIGQARDRDFRAAADRAFAIASRAAMRGDGRPTHRRRTRRDAFAEGETP